MRPQVPPSQSGTPSAHDRGSSRAAAYPASRSRAAAPSNEPAEPLDPLFRRYAAWLTARLGLRYGRETAEDLVQETFIRAARAGAADIRYPRAWLLTIARNAGRDRARRLGVRPPHHAEGACDLDRLACPTHQDEALLLKQLILALPPRMREVFVLHRFGGLTYAEIAQRLDISIKTVEARMSKALGLCAARLRT